MRSALVAVKNVLFRSQYSKVLKAMQYPTLSTESLTDGMRHIASIQLALTVFDDEIWNGIFPNLEGIASMVRTRTNINQNMPILIVSSTIPQGSYRELDNGLTILSGQIFDPVSFSNFVKPILEAERG